MPTHNPRVNVTLSLSLDMLVSRIAALERVSKSQVLRELLEAAEPSLQRAVAMMEAAVNARVSARADLAAGLAKSQRDLEESLESSLALLASHARDLVSDAEVVRGRRPARKAGGAGRPPPSLSRIRVVAAAAGGKPSKDAKVADALSERFGDPPISNRGVKSSRKR